jgi:hypothetical protein
MRPTRSARDAADASHVAALRDTSPDGPRACRKEIIAMKKMFVAGIVVCALALGMSMSASAQAMLDPPGDSGFYECTAEIDGFVMRYAVGIPPSQIVYVYQCQGGSWNLIDIEYY